MTHVLMGMAWSGRHAEISILQLGRGREGLRVTLEHDRTTHQHISVGRDGKCHRNILLDQDAADAHLATDPVDRLVHTLDDEQRKTERRLVSPPLKDAYLGMAPGPPHSHPDMSH